MHGGIYSKLRRGNSKVSRAAHHWGNQKKGQDKNYPIHKSVPKGRTLTVARLGRGTSTPGFSTRMGRRPTVTTRDHGMRHTGTSVMAFMEGKEEIKSILCQLAKAGSRYSWMCGKCRRVSTEIRRLSNKNQLADTPYGGPASGVEVGGNPSPW